jgi:hypothetical protein
MGGSYHLERAFDLTDNDWKKVLGGIQLTAVYAIELPTTNKMAFFRLAP